MARRTRVGRSAFRRSKPASNGITLLELLLALALTGVVMAVISMAIHLHLRMLDAGRADVEQSQVARAVLQHIAADIRNAVWYEALDTDSIAGLATEGVGGNTGGSGDAGGGETGGDGDNGDNGDSGDNAESLLPDGASLPDDLMDLGLDTEMSENTVDIVGTLAPPSVPGLYGNQFELQVDCSRLPRVDQYAAVSVETDQGAAPSVPSDVKTVAYFLRTDDLAPSAGTLGADNSATGLVRRELARAAASYAAQDGSLDPAQHPGQLLASEVTYLEFRYFDGSSWYSEWDSQQMGGLPVAIEITIGIDPAAGRNSEELDVADVRELEAVQQDQNLYIYRLTVHLPVAKPVVADELSSPLEEGMDL